MCFNIHHRVLQFRGLHVPKHNLLIIPKVGVTNSEVMYLVYGTNHE